MSVTITGNMTRDPELKFSNGGNAILNFSVATNRRFISNGEQKEEVSFFDCVLFGDGATNAAASLAKGHRVIVTGRLHQNNWTDETGAKKSRVEIVVEDLGLSFKFATALVAVKASNGTEAF